jgi:23S rRNA pseudouridine1911/1915/1917 synthase
MTDKITMTAVVPESLDGARLDQIAANVFSEYSRGRLQTWIKEGCLLVNSRQLRSKDKLTAGDVLVLVTELPAPEEGHWQAEPVQLDIVFEDDDILVLNKPAGTVVHPAAGNRSGTLMNGLLHYCPALQNLPRAGIVHRLDKDTTGLMVVAKTLQAHHRLVRQLQKREVSRQYEAVVLGVLTAGGTVDEPLGRHPVMRKKRAVIQSGKESVTHYRVISRFRAHTHIQCQLETGRTHQIRVHMTHIRHPLVGDPVYGGRLNIPGGCSPQLATILREFKRQALHAARLGFIHPISAEEVSWEVPLPEDMLNLLAILKADMS